MCRWLFRAAVILWLLLLLFVAAFFLVDVTGVIQRIPSDWVRAKLCSLLDPESKLYCCEEASIWPPSNSLILTMADTGPYARELLLPYLDSQDADVRFLAAVFILGKGGEREADATLRELVRRAQADDAPIADEARALLAAIYLAERRDIVGYDYLASCLPRQDEIGTYAGGVFGFALDDVLGEPSLVNQLEEHLEPLFNTTQVMPLTQAQVGQAAKDWYEQNRDDIARELEKAPAAGE